MFILPPWQVHVHRHVLAGVSYPGVPVFSVFTGQPPAPTTWVLYRCACTRPGHLRSELIGGRWAYDVTVGLTPAEEPARVTA
jgi:hypothetical protein